MKENKKNYVFREKELTQRELFNILAGNEEAFFTGCRNKDNQNIFIRLKLREEVEE